MQIIPFEYENNEIRVIQDSAGEPWWFAKDVCRVLDIVDSSQAVERLDDDEKLIRTLYASGQNREIWTINEPGLYSLIVRSNKPEAKQFKRWITHEVLPSIRKTGKYEVGKVHDERFGIVNSYREDVLEEVFCMVGEIP